MSLYIALANASATTERCHVFCDGLTVRAGPDCDLLPDAVVHVGARLAPDDIEARNPVIVAEVLSHATSAEVFSRKLSAYFEAPSIHHYLILTWRRHEIVHHRRADDRSIVTRICAEGRITLDPPGITIAVADVYADLDA